MKIRLLNSLNLKNKIVLVRADLNVPLEKGRIKESTRIKKFIPTLLHLEKEAKQIHILSHLGRPRGKNIPSLSLLPIFNYIKNKYSLDIAFCKNFANFSSSKIILHENIRFYPEEEKKDLRFIKKIIDKTKVELFIMDGFGVIHRDHASVSGFAKFLPSAAGLLMEHEISTLSPFLTDTKLPGLCFVVGGAKVKGKIGILKRFSRIADNILIGGALGNTFLAGKGYEVAQSLYEKHEISRTRDIMAMSQEQKTGIHTALDAICADQPDGIFTNVPVRDICGDMKIFDIGPHTISSFAEVIAHSRTIVWNGPMGLFENPSFAKGTIAIAQKIAENKLAKKIVGGGDTLSALKMGNIPHSSFTHVSTGGGSMLRFLEEKKLPGLEIIKL